MSTLTLLLVVAATLVTWVISIPPTGILFLIKLVNVIWICCPIERCRKYKKLKLIVPNTQDGVQLYPNSIRKDFLLKYIK